MTVPPLAGAHEAARILGVSKQRVHQLQERADFPAPVVRLAATPVWLVSDIEHFAAGRVTRPGRPSRSS